MSYKLELKKTQRLYFVHEENDTEDTFFIRSPLVKFF